MTPTNIYEEVKAYEKGPLDNLTIQDALTITLLYAARFSPESAEAEIKRIKALQEKNSLFNEDEIDIWKRINLYDNTLKTIDLNTALKPAVETLKESGMAHTAFKMAVKVTMPDRILTETNKKILDELADKLSLDDRFVRENIRRTRHRS